MDLGSTLSDPQESWDTVLGGWRTWGKTIWSQAVEACQSRHVASEGPKGPHKATRGHTGHMWELWVQRGVGLWKCQPCHLVPQHAVQETLQKQPSRNPSPSLEQTLPCLGSEPHTRGQTGKWGSASWPGVPRRVGEACEADCRLPGPWGRGQECGSARVQSQASLLPGCMLLSKALCL